MQSSRQSKSLTMRLICRRTSYDLSIRMERFVGNRPALLARKETDTNSKRKHNHVKRDTSIQVQVVYTEHCARRGALSKANQAMTSNLLPNSDPLNIEHLR